MCQKQTHALQQKASLLDTLFRRARSVSELCAYFAAGF